MRILGGGGGDPHFTTLDGLIYTYNGLGEFVMSSDTTNTINIQCRTTQSRDDQNNLIAATVYSAVGVYVQGGAQVYAELNSGGTY